MTEETGRPEEHDLRALLAAADPAAALPAADPDRVARLMELTMSHTSEVPEPGTSGTPHTDESRSDHLRHRSPFTWAVAAAAVAVIVGGVGFAVLGGDDARTQVASDEPTVVNSQEADDAAADPGAEEPTVTDLGISPAAATTKCLTPEAAPQVVASQDVVVDAVVESISGGEVTLAPTRFYAGEETDLVTVSEPSGDLQLLLTGVEFVEGERFLVSATDGQVTLCGFSAPWSESLAAVYDEAFAG